jgi:predicted porin
MLFPSLAIFMTHNALRYQYAGIVGDDIGMFVSGRNLTFLQLIKKWDLSIGTHVAHLVAEPTKYHNMPNQRWMHDRHTRGL